jgi:hypothetical protein
MSTLTLSAIGLGLPAVGLLVGRWLTQDDVAASMRRHRQALDVLAEATAEGPTRTMS